MTNVIHLFSRKGEEDSRIADSRPAQAGQQLSLPFGAPHVLYLLSGDVDASSDEFCHFLMQKDVAIFFDLRFSPRLDFVASSRSKALLQFKGMGVVYCDVFGRSGVSSPGVAFDERLEILKEVVAVADDVLKNGESCLMLFDSQPLARVYVDAMAQCFDVHPVDGEYVKDVGSEFGRLRM